MAQTLIRFLVGLTGLVCLGLAAGFLTSPAWAGAQLGLDDATGLGLSTVRADFTAFFGVAGAMSLAAALRNEARLLTTPLVIFAIALTTRVATLIFIGSVPGIGQAMTGEVLLVLVNGLGRVSLAAGR